VRLRRDRIVVALEHKVALARLSWSLDFTYRTYRINSALKCVVCVFTVTLSKNEITAAC
jgi:hypothetical protein